MKCPLMVMARFQTQVSGFPADYNCLQEKCAWWQKENSTCAVLTLGQGITYLHKALLAIENKMPHEAQFRK